MRSSLLKKGRPRNCRMAAALVLGHGELPRLPGRVA